MSSCNPKLKAPKANIMKPKKESLSFGYYLQSIRLEKNITLDTVAEETRIAMSNLTSIEKEDVESLPDPVFVKGFLRSYAQTIGADGDEAVRLYEARLNMKNRLEDAQSYSPRSTLAPWRNLILSIIAVAGLIALSLYGISYFQQRDLLDETAAPSSVMESPAEKHLADHKPSDTKTGMPPETPSRLVLQISALEDTWMKIIVDNQEPKEYNLRSGDQLEEIATMGYNMLIGNAAGLELKLNGKPLKISGKEGEIVNLQIP
jgi:cytoskeletal protein RodZ